MKPSFKTTTLIAAIGMIVYALYVVARYAIHELFPAPYHYEFWNDICERLVCDILLVSLIVAGIGLYRKRPMNTSKPFRILTICLFVTLISTIVFSQQYTYCIVGIGYMFPPFYWRVILLDIGIAWLFMLRKQPQKDATPRSYQVTLIITMTLLALPIILEAISGLALLSGREMVVGFQSGAIKTWVKYIAPILLLIHLVFPSIKEINLTRNSHCVHDSFEERTFKRNRIITMVVVGITITAIIVILACSYFLNHLYYCRFYHPHFANAYFVTDAIVHIYAYTLLFASIVSWIMLSIMAFRQLPNPTGYKIYNVVCQCITLGSLFLAVIFSLAGQPIAETFVVLFIIAGCAFYITTTIRVISYSLPIGVDK